MVQTISGDATEGIPAGPQGSQIMAGIDLEGAFLLNTGVGMKGWGEMNIAAALETDPGTDRQYRGRASVHESAEL